VLVLPAKEQLKVFDPAENKHNERTGASDDEHAFENPHQHNDNQIHKLSMLFETRGVDQFQIVAEKKCDFVMLACATNFL
jgi:hypothetical protein